MHQLEEIHNLCASKYSQNRGKPVMFSHTYISDCKYTHSQPAYVDVLNINWGTRASSAQEDSAANSQVLGSCRRCHGVAIAMNGSSPGNDPIFPPPSLRCRQPTLWPVEDTKSSVLCPSCWGTVPNPAVSYTAELGRRGSNPLHVRHAERNRAPMLHCSLHQCWTALWPRGKNGRFKTKQISSLFACSHAYCHNEIENWGTPKYKRKALLLHAKSLLRACRANENDTMTA